MPAGNSTARPYNRKEKKAIKDEKDISKAYDKIYGSKKLSKGAKKRMADEVMNSKKSKSSAKALVNRKQKENKRKIGQELGMTRRVEHTKMTTKDNLKKKK